MKGTDIKAWRKDKRLSQRALGELIGVTYTTIHNWEAGKNPVPRHMSYTLLGIDARALVDAHK